MSITIRSAETADGQDVRTVTRRSLQNSYSLSPADIDAAVGTWYDREAFQAKLERPAATVLVADVDGEVVGFAESALADDGGGADGGGADGGRADGGGADGGRADGGAEDGDLRWLHVRPTRRGRGIGSRLFERTREELEAAGADRLRATVLARNAEGNSFYRRRGLRKVGNAVVEIDARRYVEDVYAEPRTQGLRRLATSGHRDVYVDLEDADPGSNAPIHPVYDDPDRQSRFGAYCGNCDSLANAMDPMGRVECPSCGNVGSATRRDASYL